MFSALAAIALFGSLFTVNESERCVVTTMGAYSRTANPGVNFKAPIVQGKQCWRAVCSWWFPSFCG